ncbi:MAG: phosphatidate cytidylyltransferase [Sphingobacteriales bacterium]|nr:phosphatidate cytidylyltransferase [Sphingobacteriales bacterium]
MKTFQKHNLNKRSLTGFLYALIVLLAVFSGKWAFLILLLLFDLLASLEYYRIVADSKKSFLFVAGLLVNILLLILSTLMTFELLSGKVLILIFAIEAALSLLFFRDKWFSEISFLLTGHFWIAAPLSLLAYYSARQGVYSQYFVLIPFLLIWAYDVFAYLTGILIGRRKMAPAISPLKTMEGLAGGITATIILAIFIPKLFTLSGNILFWSGTGLMVAIGATAGDLFESGFKRYFGVKDSGTLLPGHGGVLDRIDSLLFVIPFYITVNQLFL